MVKRIDQQSVISMATLQGLKMTPQRRAIVEHLQDAFHHPTVEEIFNAVNRNFPMTSRATVYNTINWLKEAGMVKELYEGDSVHFDPNTDRHHHFCCRKCGQIEDIDFEVIDSVKIGALLNHTVENFEVMLRGLCAACRKLDAAKI